MGLSAAPSDWTNGVLADHQAETAFGLQWWEESLSSSHRPHLGEDWIAEQNRHLDAALHRRLPRRYIAFRRHTPRLLPALDDALLA